MHEETLKIIIAGTQKQREEFLLYNSQSIEDITKELPYLREGYDVVINGKQIPNKDWLAFRLSPEDEITFVPNFGAGGIALAIMGLAAAPAVAFTATYIMYAALTMAISIGISLGVGYLIKSLTPSPKKAAETPSQAYSWEPKTTQQQGLVKPKIFGKFKSLGNIIAGHVSIKPGDKTKLVMNALVAHGTGPVKSVSDIRLNNQPNTNFPDVVTDTRRGLLEQTPIAAFVPLRIQFRPNIDITNTGGPLIWEVPDDDYEDIEVIIRHSVYHFNKDGSKKNQSLTYKIEVRELPTGEWQTVTQPTIWNTGTDKFWINYKLSDYVTIIQGKKHELKITKISGDLSAEQKDHRQQELTMEFVSETSSDALEYPGLVLVGITGVLTDAFTGLQSASCVIEGQIVYQWDDTAEEWILDWTDNPGYVAGYTLTQPVISGDGAGTPYAIEKLEGMPDARINWEDVKELAAHCDTECPDGKGGVESLITFNGSFDTAISTWNATLDVCKIARSVPIWKGNIVDFVIDKPTARTDVIAAGNIIDGSFDETFLPKKDRVSAIDIAYNDINSNYDRVFLKTFSGILPESSNVLTLDFRGIVKKTEAWRLAKFHQAYNDHIHRTIKCKADIDALTYKLGDVLGVQWDATNWNKLKDIGQRGSGRIKAFTYDAGGDIVTLDYNIEDAFEDGNTYEILIRLRDGTQVLKTIASAVENIVTIVGHYEAEPYLDDLWVVGLQNYVLKDFRLINRNRSKKISYELALLEYDEAIWANDLLEPPVTGLYTTPAKSDSGSVIQPVSHSDLESQVPQIGLGTLGGGGSYDSVDTTNIKFVAVLPGEDELKDSFEQFDGTGSTAYGVNWCYQTFTTTSAYTISGVALNCWKYGSPGNITVSIRAVDGAGKPTGADLCSAIVADTEITTLSTLAWYTFIFGTSYALADATKYAIVWRAPNGDAGNYFQAFGYDSSGYADGGYGTSPNSGSSWSDPSATRDMNFRTYGNIPAGQVAWEAEDEETEMLLNYLGVVYTITPGQTGLKYIYWNPVVSETTLQATDDQSIIVAGDFSVLCFNKDGQPYVQ